MGKSLCSFAVVCVLLGSAGPAVAGDGQLYRWVDENGTVHFGDSVPPEYAKTERHIVNEHGISVDVLPAEKTEEQLQELVQKLQEMGMSQEAIEQLLGVVEANQEALAEQVAQQDRDDRDQHAAKHQQWRPDEVSSTFDLPFAFGAEALVRIPAGGEWGGDRCSDRCRYWADQW